MGRKKERNQANTWRFDLPLFRFESLDGLKRQSLVWGDWLEGPTGCMPCGVSQVCGVFDLVSESTVRKVHGLVSWGHPGDGCAPRCVERPIGWRRAAGGARKAVRRVQWTSRWCGTAGAVWGEL